MNGDRNGRAVTPMPSVMHERKLSGCLHGCPGVRPFGTPAHMNGRAVFSDTKLKKRVSAEGQRESIAIQLIRDKRNNRMFVICDSI